ncbi:hypothetical protein Syun_004442 [Stephania yunnanensis]|uniref:Uncharacterized protein n=1 Tax=Stephania yunnanensis TaxID=152371 RepID=A0AAP0Q1F5_9MAGN
MVDGVTMKAGWEEHYGCAGVTLVDWRRSPCKMSHFNGSILQRYIPICHIFDMLGDSSFDKNDHHHCPYRAP